MSGNGKRLLVCIALSLLMCVAHVRGSTMMILGVLAIFMALMTYACVTDYAFPMLLFFLPWGPILRLNPQSFSFYTFALMLVCIVSVLKKKFRFKRYHLVVGFLLLPLTLLSKLLGSHMISFDYIAFLSLILIFPVVKEEWTAGKYDFYQIVTFFSVGIIVAALSAMGLSTSANIAKFIKVDAYLTIIRRCGFYGDANFYTAQITAAMGGVMMDLLQKKKKIQNVFEFILLLLLVYCGFLSGSKSFVLIVAALMILWAVALFRLRGRTGFKLLLALAIVLAISFIATSELFRDLIAVMETRFSFRSNISDFTTGRTDLWENYVEELVRDWKTLVLGKGFTNIKIGGKSTHNTLLQMLFQFGMVGMPLLLGWSVFFFRDTPPKPDGAQKQPLYILLLVIGAFAPWLAIDALFFDEFFLLQMYVYLGCRRIERGNAPRVPLTEGTDIQISEATLSQTEVEA